MKKLKISVLDKSTGDTGTVKNLYGSRYGFSAAVMVSDTGKPTKNIRVNHLKITAISGIDLTGLVELPKGYALVEIDLLRRVKQDLSRRSETGNDGCKVVNLGATLWSRLSNLVDSLR